MNEPIIISLSICLILVLALVIVGLLLNIVKVAKQDTFDEGYEKCRHDIQTRSMWFCEDPVTVRLIHMLIDPGLDIEEIRKAWRRELFQKKIEEFSREYNISEGTE